jgi:uncharacterized membrane protein
MSKLAITSLNSSVLSGCTSLETIVLPDVVTSIVDGVACFTSTPYASQY